MYSTKKILFSVAAVLILLSPIICNAAAVPRSRTLIIAQAFDPYHLWPPASGVSEVVNCGQAIVEALMYPDPRTGTFKGVFAESWRPLNDTTWQIKLRKGISFTNGEPMNADAAKFSFELFMDTKLAGSFALYSKPLKSVEKVDDYTINVYTHDPFPALVNTLYNVWIVPPKYWNEVGGLPGFDPKPIGTGPFKFTEWKKDEHIIMDKNEKYWGELPKGIDRVIWKPVPDDTARAAGLETGEYDIAVNISVNSVPRIEAKPNLRLISIPSWRMFTLRLSTIENHPGPLHNQKVRQAINHAIDKESIIKNLFFGKARILEGQILRKEQFGFNPKLKAIPYDPEKAKRLLAEAGYPNGFEITFSIPVGRYAQDKEVCEAVAGMLGRVGVRCKMDMLESGAFLKKLTTKDLGPIYFVGTAPPPDPHYMLYFEHSTQRTTYLQNPEYDKLV